MSLYKDIRQGKIGWYDTEAFGIQWRVEMTIGQILKEYPKKDEQGNESNCDESDEETTETTETKIRRIYNRIGLLLTAYFPCTR